MTKQADKLSTQSAVEGMGYVTCTAEPGMFNDELLVFIKGFDPKSPTAEITVQVLVDSDLVEVDAKPERGRPAPGKLRVGVVTRRGELATVVLPQPGIPVGEAMLVKRDALVKK